MSENVWKTLKLPYSEQDVYLMPPKGMFLLTPELISAGVSVTPYGILVIPKDIDETAFQSNVYYGWGDKAISLGTLGNLIDDETATADPESDDSVIIFYDGATNEFYDNKGGRIMYSVIGTITPVQEGTGDPSPSNIRTISGINKWILTNNDTIIAEVPFVDENENEITVYGGTIDAVVEGSLGSIWKMIDLGDLDWTYVSGDDAHFYSTISDYLHPFSSSETAEMLCSKYKPVPANAVVNNSIALSSDSSNRVYVKDSRYNDAIDFKTAVTGTQLLYQLLTPVWITFTPLEIKSIFGNNKIKVNNGTISIGFVYTKDMASGKFVPITEYEIT